MKLKSLSLLLVLVCAFLVACSSGPAEPTLNPTQGAQMLAGKYSTAISAADITKANSLDPGIGANQGQWQIVFTNDGKFNADKDGQFMAEGKFTVKGGEIEVYVNTTCADCGCSAAIGRYNWVLKENNLGFVKLAGICDAMDIVLTSHALTRQP